MSATTPNRLKDLEKVIAECRERINAHEPSAPITIPGSLWALIRDAYLGIVTQSSAELIGDHTIKIVTASGKKLFISAQELPQIWGTIPYARAASEYERALDILATKYFGFSSRWASEAEPVFKQLPMEDWETDLGAEAAEVISDFLKNELTEEQDRERFRKFLATKGKNGWSGVSKELSRGDWLLSAIPFVGEWLAVGAAERGTLVVALSADPLIEAGLEIAIKKAEQEDGVGLPVNTNSSTLPRIEGGDNELFYGAPGTGKSHKVWERIHTDSDPHFVTVFHPDMQNSDFVGTLKPGVTKANSEEADNETAPQVTYAFRPGPFARAVAEAWASPDMNVYLVIEELNRAAAPAVFGELFQLLDRKEDGSSRYEVDFSSPEFEDWFCEETEQDHERLSLPSNLSILATMNSADQGVYPLDTAFRRRWRQHYLPIDYGIAPDKDLAIQGPNGTVKTDWKTLVEALNGFLVQHLEVNEDRLIGPRFVDEHDLGEGTLPGKLLIYLWDDLLRHHPDKAPFHPDISTYGELDSRLNDGKQVFSDGFIAGIAQDGSETGEASAVGAEALAATAPADTDTP